MKKLIFLAILFITSCKTTETKCYQENTKKCNEKQFEIIDMGGCSTFMISDMSEPNFKFHKIDTKEPKIRHSEGYYKSFNLTLKLYANEDTGNDRITVYHGENQIFQTHFGVYNVKCIDFHFPDEIHNKLKFVVDNTGTINNTPGAFSATIKIKKL